MLILWQPYTRNRWFLSANVLSPLFQIQDNVSVLQREEKSPPVDMSLRDSMASFSIESPFPHCLGSIQPHIERDF